MDENNNAKVDYEAMLKAALDKMKQMLADESEYFQYLYLVDLCAEDIKIVSENMMKMNISDQLQLLKAVYLQGAICQKLKEKYKFEKGESHAES